MCRLARGENRAALIGIWVKYPDPYQRGTIFTSREPTQLSTKLSKRSNAVGLSSVFGTLANLSSACQRVHVRVIMRAIVRMQMLHTPESPPNLAVQTPCQIAVQPCQVHATIKISWPRVSGNSLS